MFGKNKITKQNLGDGLLLPVKQIFRTFQGEGELTGHPAIFIRLAGCNLRCYFCDTDFEDTDGLMDVGELIHQVKELARTELGDDIKQVVITGGEPLIHNLIPLITQLVDSFINVQIETAGTVSIPKLTDLKDECNGHLKITCSPKTGKVHSDMAELVDVWKYIWTPLTSDHLDGLPMLSTQVEGKPQRIARPTNNKPVYLQPMDVQSSDNKFITMKCAQAALKHGYRVSIQTHKIMGVE